MQSSLAKFVAAAALATLASRPSPLAAATTNTHPPSIEPALQASRPAYGPLYHDFPLTLVPGSSQNAIGPLLGRESADGATLWRFSPLFSLVSDPTVERTEWDFLYPLLTYDRFGEESRLQLLQFLSLGSRGGYDGESRKQRSIFPFYFQQKSSPGTNDYFALLPFYGRIQNHLFRDEVRFVLAPLWLQTRKKDVVTDNYLAPFFHRRHGNQLTGWQFWPLYGSETKNVTQVTNAISEELETIAGHRKQFALWPFGIYDETGIGTTNRATERALLPLYRQFRSPTRDNTTVLWPFFTRTEDRERQFIEWGAPYPFIGWAHGPGKTARRLWPLAGRATTANVRQEFLLWPLWTHKHLVSDPFERERTRSIFYFYDDLREKNLLNNQQLHRRSLWPLFMWRHEMDGRERLQLLAPLEPLLPNNVGIERNYASLWSVWRQESHPKTQHKSRSLLWNLWRRDESPNFRRTSAFFGAFQSEQTATQSRWRLLGIPITKSRPAAAPAE